METIYITLDDIAGYNFADYGNPEDWNEKFSDEHKAFLDAYGEKCFTK